MPPKRKKSLARAMPVDTILTRNRMAQLKQNNTMNKIKGKPVEVNDNLKLRRSKRKISEKKIEIQEFNPKTYKRKVASRIVPLIPKRNYTVVADMNQWKKRKTNAPKKVVTTDVPREEYNASLSSDTEDLTVSELVTLYNASEEMTDEDFMEILTCPSPVWWEDPPPGFEEDSMSAKLVIKNEMKVEIIENTRKVDGSDTAKKYKKKSYLEKTASNIVQNQDKTIEKKTKYLTKCKNLESVLGSLKTKSNKSIVTPCSSNPNESVTINAGDIDTTERIILNQIKTCTTDNDVAKNVLNLNRNVNIESKENIESLIIDVNPINTLVAVDDKKNRVNNIEIIEITSDENDQDDLINDSLCAFENIDIPIENST